MSKAAKFIFVEFFAGERGEVEHLSSVSFCSVLCRVHDGDLVGLLA
jgi:hypothetical protein